jgi:ParB family transcriptional regulator, chromosome partitioning protein
MSDKRRLGKGLGALIPDALDASADKSEIELDKIKQNPYQPRQDFNEEKLKELAGSIREYGILQAVVITPANNEDEFYLVAGERRCRAAKMAGLKTIPAIIKSYDNKTMLEIALIENLQREDLNPVEEATAYQRLMKEYSYTQEELAGRLGKSRSAIANSVRLLALPESVLGLLKNGQVTAGQVRPLLSISDPGEQELLAHRIVDEGLTARDTEKLSFVPGKVKATGPKKNSAEQEDPVQAELQMQMQRRLGTKVKIKQGKNGGTIEIFYYGEEDLERLITRILPEGL